MDLGKKYWSPGKLLISSEYVVVDGAKAFALPTKYGQSLTVAPCSSPYIHWTSKTNEDQIWFEGKFHFHSLEIVDSSDEKVAQKLQQILRAAMQIKGTNEFNGCIVETKLDFPQNWGLGSSSTLLCNIAKWQEIDAFKLHFTLSNGSGYDIACGLSNTPLLYEVNDQAPTVKEIAFNPSFSNNIYFIHLNQKQYSDQEVARYGELKKDYNLEEVTQKFTGLTNQLLNATNLQEFETIIIEHEQLMSHVLQRETIRESLFQLYAGGVIKSLGAWGGDFVMVTCKTEADLDYFRAKGFHTILTFDQLINN